MFKTMKRIIRWAGKYQKRLWLGAVFSFFSSFMTAVPTMTAAYALDQAIQAYWRNSRIENTLIWQSLWIIVFSIAFNFLFSYLKAVLQESIGYEVASGQRIHLGDILKRVPLGYFSRNNVGEILTGVTTELSTLELQGMKMVDVIINGYAKFIAILLCFIWFSPAAAFISAAGVILSALALSGISKNSERTAGVTHKSMEAMSSAAIEYIRGLPIVKSFGQEGVSIERFHEASRALKDIHIKIEKGYTPFNCLHLFALKLASMGIVLVCAWQTLQGQISLAYFLMFVLFSFVLFGSVETINEASHTLGVIDSAMDKLESLENVKYIDEDGSDIRPDSCDIVFENVSFGYEAHSTVLKDLNFTIPQNTTTAIVGPSGSGKSTLCNLIARFYDVNSGKITLGGRDLREFTCDSLLKNISMVFQNVYLFRDTIRNNIKFGSPDATEAEIVAAAKAACCHDFIMALPQGYDTIVGESGSSLSGGEKQRISIARAMLKNAPIVILDEATASIDPENEHLIQEAISALTHGKTIIIIAHRLATIEKADQILVIDGGTVAQKGTHEELLRQEGTYRKFIAIREKAEGWRI
ncbi:MAG: ABC transporter ATP-binding protein [Lachnospiraceae bacterium]|nr:ABC transporter ATP-binding protein [Lachnospiraceae bacterium]